MASRSYSSIIFWAFVALVVFRLVCAAFLPIATDEAYYAMWGRVPDFGYFDHPPVVAWLAAFAPPGADVFWLRLPGVIVASLAFWVQVRTYRMLGLAPREVTTAMLIVSGSLLGLLFGFLLTPDLPQILFWSLMAHELVAALYVDERRWLSLGVVLGLGFISKYTMVLWVPVLVWVVTQNFALLKNRYLYGGALLCFVAMSPHLIWQANHDFLAFKFQLNHGIKESRTVSPFQLNTDLPEPVKPAPVKPEPEVVAIDLDGNPVQPPVQQEQGKDAEQDKDEAQGQDQGTEPKKRYKTPVFEDSPEGEIEAYFASKDEPEEIKEKTIKPQWQVIWDRINEYIGIVLAPLGFIAIGAILYGLWQLGLKLVGRRRAPAEEQLAAEGLPVAKKSLLWVCTLSPVAFFGAIAMFSKVEANWPAAYLITAAPLLAPWFSRHGKILKAGIALNAVAVIALVLHAHYPHFAKKPQKDRVLRESHGYEQLAQLLQGLEVPLLADTYQNVSMLNHYNPSLRVAQWPGITRYSELVRRKEFGFYQHDDFGADDGFYLLTDHRKPIKIEGYHPRWTVEIRDCLTPVAPQTKTASGGVLAYRQKPGPLPPNLELNRSFAPGGYQPLCTSFSHSWYLTRHTTIHFQ